MKRTLLWSSFTVLYVVHQDVWNWRAARPLTFGFLPVGLAYHAVLTLAAAGFAWALVRLAWPERLEREVEELSRNRES